MKTTKPTKPIFTIEELEKYFHHSYGEKVMTLAQLALCHRTGQLGGSPTAEQELAELIFL